MKRLVLKGFGGCVALSTLTIVLWSSTGSRATQKQTEPSKTVSKSIENKLASIPLTQAVLYTNGVGYFEREGTVNGNVEIELACRLGEINDLLKSLLVQDLDRGRIGAVSLVGPVDQYPSHASLEGFMENNPTWQEILLLARGTPVEVTMEPPSPSAATPAPVSGVLISIQTPVSPQPEMDNLQVNPAGPAGGGLGKFNQWPRVTPVSLREDAGNDGQTLQLKLRNELRPEPARLQLLTNQGYVTLRMDQVKRVKLLDQQLEQAIRTALAKVPRPYQALGNQQTSVRLRFEGAGQRRVRIGYLREQPMWKTSYRLVLDDKGPAQLHGWAIVENTSDEDWDNIQLRLIAGQPVSFRMDLHSTLQPARPEASVPSYRPFLPTGHQALFDRQSGPVATLPNLNGEMAQSPRGFGGIGGGGYGGMGGMGGLGGGGLGGAVGGGSGLRLPNNSAMRDLPADKSGERSAAVEKTIRDEDTASAAPVGTYFEYTVTDPVSLTKGKTSLVSLLQTAIPVERLSLVQQRNANIKPLLALRIRNDTKMLLGAGPVTIFDRRQFAGEAQLPEVASGAKTFMTYGVDAHLQVSAKAKTTIQPREVELRYSQLGGYVEKLINEETETVLFTNRDSLPRQVLIEKPRREKVTLVKPAESKESDDHSIRFLTEIAPGQRGEFSIITSESHETARDQSVARSEPGMRTFIVNDLGTLTVLVEDLPEQPGAVKGKAGKLILTNLLQRRYQYILKAFENRSWSGSLKHGIDHTWEVSRLPEGSKVINAELVLPITVAAAKPTTISFLQEKQADFTTALSKVSPSELTAILRDRTVPAELKTVLEDALTQLQNKASLEFQLSTKQERLKEIDMEQNRLRANMKDLPREAPLYKRYLEKFDKQEQEIDELRDQSAKVKLQLTDTLSKISDLERRLK